MNKTIYRVIFLVICILLLGYGLAFERHRVRALDTDQTQTLSGPVFIQGATVDSFMLKDGQVFDVYSLSKTMANEKDCKT
ncbi:MAG: hypothetical protein NTU53_09400 [Planctomycetota bacterium]|nr:hypothetical protein [Planctomycetota bacterium]